MDCTCSNCPDCKRSIEISTVCFIFGKVLRSYLGMSSFMHSASYSFAAHSDRREKLVDCLRKLDVHAQFVGERLHLTWETPSYSFSVTASADNLVRQHLSNVVLVVYSTVSKVDRDGVGGSCPDRCYYGN